MEMSGGTSIFKLQHVADALKKCYYSSKNKVIYMEIVIIIAIARRYGYGRY